MNLDDIFTNDKSIVFDGFSSNKDYEKEHDKMEDTMDITALNLSNFLNEDSSCIEKIVNPQTKTEEISDKQIIAESFINCSVLSFLTAFMGASWFINILNHI